MKPDAVPKFFKARSVPYALKKAVEKDLERLKLLGVMTKVNYSDWAAPIVSVLKPGGSIRVCGDYKVTINLVLEIDHYPLPSPEDLFAMLAGGRNISKLDLPHAYQQVFLEKSPQSLSLSAHTRACIDIISFPSA